MPALGDASPGDTPPSGKPQRLGALSHGRWGRGEGSSAAFCGEGVGNVRCLLQRAPPVARLGRCRQGCRGGTGRESRQGARAGLLGGTRLVPKLCGTVGAVGEGGIWGSWGASSLRGEEEQYDFKHAYFYFLSFFQFLFKQCGSLRARSVPRLMP